MLKTRLIQAFLRMFSSFRASEAFRDANAPDADLSKMRSFPIKNFGTKILHVRNCPCKSCRKLRAKLKSARNIYKSTKSLYKLIGLSQSEPIFQGGKLYRYGFIVQCSRRKSTWCREELCKHRFAQGKWIFVRGV